MNFCWKCAKVVSEIPINIGFRAACPCCDSDLHVCRNCRYHSPGKPNDCLVPGTESIRDREASNLCEEFRFRISSKTHRCRAQDGFVNFGCHSKIDPNEEDHPQVGKPDEENRFCKDVSYKNSQNLAKRGLSSEPAQILGEPEKKRDFKSLFKNEEP